ncbi:MAG: hypothetical protein IPH97_04705 [Ignavibacteriales bacterium]|nr:hypothetical protein [Ignavibacteriales bacterium]
MKKGCALSFGCTGIIVILLFAVVVINFLSNVNFSFDGFSETSSDYTFDVDTLGNQPIIVADYKWKFTSTSLGRKNYKISFKILEFEVKKALAYLDEVAELSASDLNIDSKYRFDKVNYAKRTWHEIYKRIYWQSYDKFDLILKGFDKIFVDERMNDRDKLYFIISFVQNIEYNRPGGKLDILPPLGTLATRFGDCDTKALLLYILLEKANVDCVLFWSFQYKHAMLGVAINARGNYKTHTGKNYYFVETTYPNWEIGDIDPQMDDLSLWYVDDLDSDKMEIDFKYEFKEEKKMNRTTEQKENKRNEGKDSGKRDKPSPSSN